MRTVDVMGMTDEEKRHDQLTTAPNATEADAAPRIVVSDHDGVTRIDIAEDAAVRPGEPDREGAEGTADVAAHGAGDGAPDESITTNPDGTPVDNPAG
ncbi:hypothetical protein AB0N73_12445 [Microbacterium sp. NPDC089189]|uniref:hypothetical protein n=1 Tax=Microbacterium sp. NPDC089189 TaxID=3154972 RepID=UPI0034217C69